jgi:hypothetical protein
MWHYLKLHEAFVKTALAGGLGPVDWEELRAFHNEQLGYMQQERWIHLVVTLFICTFVLLTTGYVIVSANPTAAAMAALMMVLLFFYILHYFRLENGVQRWYHLANRLSERCGRTGARYEGKKAEPFGMLDAEQAPGANAHPRPSPQQNGAT